VSRRRQARSVALLVTALLSLVACSGGNGGGLGYLTGEGTATTFAAGHRVLAPAVTGKTLDGTTLTLASYRGKIVVLNFWGSWCNPCRAEGPFLQLMATDYAAKGVQFVGVDIRDTAASAKSFLGKTPTYPNLFDPDELVTLLFNATVSPSAIPSTIIIDRSGKIAARIFGATTEPRLSAVLDPLVAEVG
jgi:thiol-disulfide isomerase/thioredoxin